MCGSLGTTTPKRLENMRMRHLESSVGGLLFLPLPGVTRQGCALTELFVDRAYTHACEQHESMRAHLHSLYHLFDVVVCQMTGCVGVTWLADQNINTSVSRGTVPTVMLLCGFR